MKIMKYLDIPLLVMLGIAMGACENPIMNMQIYILGLFTCECCLIKKEGWAKI